MQDNDSKTEVSEDASTGTGDGNAIPEQRDDIPVVRARVKTRRSMLWHISHTIGRMISAVMTIALMVSAAAVLRIATGGLDFAPLKPYIDAELERQELSHLIGYESLVLRWDDVQNDLDLLANNVRITTGATNTDQSNIVLVPSVELGIDLAEVLEGRLRVKELTLSGVYLSLNRTETGSFDIDIGLSEGSNDLGGLYDDDPASGDPDTVLPAVQSMLDQWVQGQAGNALLEKLDSVSIDNGWLNLNDRKEGRQYLARNLQLGAKRFADRIILTGSSQLYVPLDRAETEDPFLQIQAVYNPDKSFDIEMAVEKLHTAHLSALLPDIEELQQVELPVSATLQTKIDATGMPGAAEFRLLGEKGLFTRPDLFPKPLIVDALAIEGIADWQQRKLEISRATLKTDLPVLDGSLTYQESEDGPSLKLDASLTGIPVSRVMDYWPKPAAHLAREWTKEHITAGHATGATVKLDIGPSVFENGTDALKPGSIEFRFGYENLTLELFPNFPAVTGISGESVLDHKAMRYTILQGKGNNLDLSDGLVVFNEIYEDIPQAIIKFDGRGKVGDALDLINREPLSLASEFGLDPEKVKGDAQTTVVFAFPMLKDLSLSDVKVETQAKLQNVSWDNAVAGMSLENGLFDLVADNDHFSLQGTTRINGVEANVDWESRFGKDAVIRQKVNLYANLSPEDREKLKLPPLPGLEGIVGISMALFQNEEKTWSVFSTSDLTAARLSIPQVGWAKEIGTPARFTTKTEFTPNVPVIISAIEADLAGIEGRATVLVNAETQAIHQVRVRDFAFGNTKTNFTLGRDGTGGWLAVIEGDSLDIDPLLKWYRKQDDVEDPGDSETSPATDELPLVRTKVRVDNLHVTGNINIRNFRADGRYINDRIANLHAKGHMAEQGVALSITPTEGGRDFSMTMSNVGDMLSFLADNERIIGGSMIARGYFNDAHPTKTDFKGLVEVENFRLVEAPVLARMLNVATLLGIAAELEGDGIPFTKLEVPFHYKDRILEIDNGRASGTSMGLTIRGRMDDRQNKVDFEGSVIPAYALNSIFGAIPILGKLLGGANEEGLLAISYRIHGQTDEPNITVNPLSVLAPGLLRDVFSAILKGVQGDGLDDGKPVKRYQAPQIDK